MACISSIIIIIIIIIIMCKNLEDHYVNSTFGGNIANLQSKG